MPLDCLGENKGSNCFCLFLIMSIEDRVYRTCTYIAADWTGDNDLVEKLKEWNRNDNLGLSFTDAHDLSQSRDDSNPCSIKQNLRKRLNVSKVFVLIVGDKTNSLTKGSCRFCSQYESPFYGSPYCRKYYSLDHRSFIEYECEMALKDYKEGLLKRIVVIYNGKRIPDKTKCPEALRYIGTHIGSDVINSAGRLCWNYSSIKGAICG